MKNLAFSFILLLFSFGVFGQTMSINTIDTIKSTHRTFGSLDTLSNSVQAFQSIFYLTPESTLLSPMSLYANHGSMLSFLKMKEYQTKFSALPHLGFMYGFGAQGSQRLHLDFQQAYRHGLLLNVSFDKNKGNAYLRNDAFSLNNFYVQLLHHGSQYSFDFKANSQSQTRSWSNGLLSSSAIPDVDLNLQAVQKENAQSTNVLNAIRYEHKWDLDKDSIRGFGMIAKHDVYEVRRTYSEIDSLIYLYNHVYWNADTTSDRYKERTLSNQAGVFFERNRIAVQSLLNVRNRTWTDAYSAKSVNELWSLNQLNYIGKSIEVNHVSAFNMNGAAQGISSISKLQFFKGKTKLFIQHDLRNELPELIQRKYYSNNVQYDLSTLSKQWNQSFSAQVMSMLGKIQLTAHYRFMQFRNVYVFEGLMGTWVNNAAASSGIAQQAKVGVKWNFKGLQVHPTYNWTNVNHSLNFQSMHQINMHMQWKGGVFKAKKLHMLFAGDLQYLSGFQQMTFIPQMGVFDLIHNPGTPQKAYLNASFTTAIEVETFRFFIRVDNLGSYWVDPSISMLQNYPFPRMQVKIGLTWDFWN